jgi:hypothetical protein
MPHRPKWFRDSEVIISNAPTCGINKDGIEQYLVDATTGQRSDSLIDDKLFVDADYIAEGELSSGYIFVRQLDHVRRSGILVPQYHDLTSIRRTETLIARLPNFTMRSLADLERQDLITIRNGHGSPSADQRLGDIPYIKVSDLRAGHVNINPTNLIPLELAKLYWRGETSNLKPYDLISPERASKNIGDFCVLMPGQERIVLTKEVIIIRATAGAHFDQFFLLWALTLDEVRSQWRRIVLMQTNREDVGDRVGEIEIPVPRSRSEADLVARPFKAYFQSLEEARLKFSRELASSAHKHKFHAGA